MRDAKSERTVAENGGPEFFPPIKRGPDPDFAPLHFATHLSYLRGQLRRRSRMIAIEIRQSTGPLGQSRS